MLLKLIAHRQIAKRRRVAVPAHGMAAGPVAIRHGADVERHFDAEAGVVTGAAHVREIPAWAEVLRAHGRIGFETAAGEDYCFGFDFDVLAFVPRTHAEHVVIAVGEQGDRGRFVENLDAVALAGFVLVGHQAFAAAPGFRSQAAPEFVACTVIHFIRLTAVARLKLHALFTQPHHGVVAAADEDFAQVRIGLFLRDACHVIKVGIGCVGAVVVGFLFFGRELWNDFGQLIDVVKHHAHQPAGVAAVAAAIILRRGFEHDHGGALFTGGEGGAGGGVTGANDDNVGIAKIRDTHKMSFKNK